MNLLETIAQAVGSVKGLELGDEDNEEQTLDPGNYGSEDDLSVIYPYQSRAIFWHTVKCLVLLGGKPGDTCCEMDADQYN